MNNDNTEVEGFPIPPVTDEQIIQFTLQLATTCTSCSMKAQIALIAARLTCAEMLSETDDAQWCDPRTIIAAAIETLKEVEGADETEQGVAREVSVHANHTRH